MNYTSDKWVKEPQSLNLSNYGSFLWLVHAQIDYTSSQNWLNSPHVNDSFVEWRRRETDLLQPLLDPCSKHLPLHSNIFGALHQTPRANLK
ncbi:hypothetical protein QL285_007086 [Trifolium repens]|nr:hypothetical protein QL285_007086 [Trifolium repens]